MSTSSWKVPVTIEPEEWSKDDSILQNLMRGPLHQKEYVEEVERSLKVVIEEEAFTPDDLDVIWTAQDQKFVDEGDRNEEEVKDKTENGDEKADEYDDKSLEYHSCEDASEKIEENIHNLIAQLAPNFTAQHLNRLIENFQNDWNNDVRRSSILELAERIASKHVEGDALMTQKILTFLWDCVLPSSGKGYKVSDVLLNLLRSVCSKDDAQRRHWLDKCVTELKANDELRFPAVSFIKEICQLYDPPKDSSDENLKAERKLSRVTVLQRLEKDHSLIDWICENLKFLSSKLKSKSEIDSDDVESVISNGLDAILFALIVGERLSFLKYLLQDGRHWLSYKHAVTIWECLVVQCKRPVMRGSVFEWFSDLIGEKPDFHPSNVKKFFENEILNLNSDFLDKKGIRCFQKYFDAVNEIPLTLKQGRLCSKPVSTFLDRPNLIGMDYISDVVRNSSKKISKESMKMLIEEQAKLAVDGEELEKLLKCPTCKSSLKLPVYTCFSGHLICADCKEGKYSCPKNLCKESFVRTQPSVINKLLELIPVSCKNRENGCYARIPSPGMINHEKNCNYRFVKCLLCNVKDLVFCKLGDHLSEHFVYEEDFSSWHVIDVDTSAGDNNTFLFVYEIETYFVFRYTFNSENGLAYVCVQYVGKSENACEYVYDVRIDQGNENFETNDYYCCFSGSCLPYFESSDELKKHSKAFMIELKRIFLEEENPTEFKVEIRIRKRAEPLRKK